MLNTNRKLIVGSGELFISSKIMEQFSKDHTIVTFTYNPLISLKENSKIIFKKLQRHLDAGYDKYVFFGKGQDCNLYYALYEHKKMLFDAGVFVNFFPTTEKIKPETIQFLKDNSKLFSYSTGKKNGHLPKEMTNHQIIKTPLRTTRSKKLAQDMYGQIVYGVYQENFLEGPNTIII